MDSNLTRKLNIEHALNRFAHGSLDENALALFDALGYGSERRIPVPAAPDAFLQALDRESRLNRERALVEEWEAAYFLFQLTGDELRVTDQLRLIFEADKSYSPLMHSYLFLAIHLRREYYTRAELSKITREVNRLFPMPAMILFRHDATLTLSIIARRPHRRDESKDVLEKVTLIKDIRIADPHRAHTEILNDLALPKLAGQYTISSMDHLHTAWQTVLDSSELNKRFFQELAYWYFWAVENVTFPEGAGEEAALRNATSVIRLITRLIFIWFLKEKGLVPQDLFSRERVEQLLLSFGEEESSYYKAILQNLFFATLNQEMNEPGKEPVRHFRKAPAKGRASDYMVHNIYRYESHFRDPDAALKLFENIPFLNGGLFECLDRHEKGRERVQVDGFSDRADNPLRVPNHLFFSPRRYVDLNEMFDTSNKQYKVRGLIDLFNRYKFTIEENTPIEEEIALDPELLGRVFENLLAAYNPETGTTARKQTGSFYTPREIVNYMVDESLIAYLKHAMVSRVANPPERTLAKLEASLRRLFSYSEEPHGLNEKGVERLIQQIDNLKILDPACGSGAFPMGILQKLVFVLGKLDPGNERWKEEQIRKAQRIDVDSAREQAIKDIEEAFERNELDYPRKLYLIENCIFGVDIQPIAVQIAKLRFFISLVVDQSVDDTRPNRGIRPLPNLETKIVAANTLFDVQHAVQADSNRKGQAAAPAMQNLFRDPRIKDLEEKLLETRRRVFRARTRQTKERNRSQDRQIREEIAALLVKGGFPSASSLKLSQWDPYDQNASADFFDPEWMFGITEGFDVVISNPPYVRQEKIRDLKPALKQQYHSYTGVADLYVYFYERAYQLLREGGVLCYISSNKYFRSGYGQKLRALLAGNTTIHQLIDFGDAPVFTAIAYPSIILFRKKAPNGNQARVLEWQPGPPVEHFENIFRNDSFLMPQEALTADGWQLESPRVLRLLDKLRNTGTPLGEYVKGRLYRGIITGLNEAFVVDRATRDRLIEEHPSSAALLKPFLRGRDVKRWVVDYGEQYLIKIESSENKRHPWTGKPDHEAERIFARTYPAIYAHFKPLRERLIKRWDQGKYFWELRSCEYWQEFEQPKVMYQEIATYQAFALDESGAYSNNKTFLLPDAPLMLLAILNSRVAWYFLGHIASKLQGGAYALQTPYVSQLPIPHSGSKQPIETLVSQILVAKSADPAADVSALEAEIDREVYRLYGLTEEEIKIVEG
jgi:23S rRNA G2445 N2-methylase RlmL